MKRQDFNEERGVIGLKGQIANLLTHGEGSREREPPAIKWGRAHEAPTIATHKRPGRVAD